MDHRHINQSCLALMGLILLSIAGAPGVCGETLAADSGALTVDTPAETAAIGFDGGRGFDGAFAETRRNGVPTLGEVGIIVLTLAFGAFGVLLLRRKAPAEN